MKTDGSRNRTKVVYMWQSHRRTCDSTVADIELQICGAMSPHEFDSEFRADVLTVFLRSQIDLLQQKVVQIPTYHPKITCRSLIAYGYLVDFLVDYYCY